MPPSRQTLRRLVSTVALALASCRSPDARDPSLRYQAAADDNLQIAMPATLQVASETEAPMRLTASDGTGLRLAELRANVVVEGPLAFTELHLAFENPLDRTLEGTFRMALPQKASLSRFAMRVGDAWQEGEVVELAAAREAYEDFLHRKQDPALLEKAAGNEFSARVFPIPPRAIKEIILSYAEDLADAPYVLPLKGLPELGLLDITANQRGTGPAKMSQKHVVPASDFTLPHEPERARSRPTALRADHLVLVRVRPQAETKPEPPSNVLVLVDTSASRALGFQEQTRLVKDLARRLGESYRSTLTVAAFDQTVSVLYDGPAADFGERDATRLLDRGALGASDLQSALVWAGGPGARDGRKRIVLVSDGVATAGATEPEKLGAAVASLRARGIERIDAIAAGGIRDDAALSRIVRGNLPRDGLVLPATTDLGTIVRRLGEGTRSGIAVAVEGATWSYPRHLDGVQAGDEVTVYAEVPAGRPVNVIIDGKAVPIGTVPATPALLERAWAQAKIASMLEQKDGDRQKGAIVALAVKHRVMSPYTAMLVLETEQDYARFNIDRRALSDVLVVHDGAVIRQHRSADLVIARDPVEAPPGPRRAQTDRAAHSAPRSARPEAKASGTLPKKKESFDGAPVQPGFSSGAGAPSEAAGPPPPVQSLPAPQPSTAPRAVSPKASPARPSPAERFADAPAAAAAPAPAPPMMQEEARPGAPMAERDHDGIDDREDPATKGAPPYTGKFEQVMDALARDDQKSALSLALSWHTEEPGDVMSLVALGEACEARGAVGTAARAYGSILDLFSNRADLRRFAGERLERLRGGAGLDLAIDSYAKAASERPDHPASHRLLAFAYLKRKKYAQAFDAALAGATRNYPPNRFAGVDRILREDLGLIAAAWLRVEPARKQEITKRVVDAGGMLEEEPSLRFVLNWETDANDVDFHIYDAKGRHAFFGRRTLASGGELYADVTTGYGPECFTIRKSKKDRAAPYRLKAHYYSRGPMGYGMGKLQIIDHDGKGNLTFEERPFVVMVDQAYVDLGTVE
jgi:tetratricopeptide (TPR) repeat protein